MAYAAVNGLNMYYEVHGDGPPLLLLHSGPIQSSVFGWRCHSSPVGSEPFQKRPMPPTRDASFAPSHSLQHCLRLCGSMHQRRRRQRFRNFRPEVSLIRPGGPDVEIAVVGLQI